MLHARSHWPRRFARDSAPAPLGSDAPLIRDDIQYYVAASFSPSLGWITQGPEIWRIRSLGCITPIPLICRGFLRSRHIRTEKRARLRRYTRTVCRRTVDWCLAPTSSGAISGNIGSFTDGLGSGPRTSAVWAFPGNLTPNTPTSGWRVIRPLTLQCRGESGWAQAISQDSSLVRWFQREKRAESPEVLTRIVWPRATSD